MRAVFHVWQVAYADEQALPHLCHSSSSEVMSHNRDFEDSAAAHQDESEALGSNQSPGSQCPFNLANLGIPLLQPPTIHGSSIDTQPSCPLRAIMIGSLHASRKRCFSRNLIAVNQTLYLAVYPMRDKALTGRPCGTD